MATEERPCKHCGTPIPSHREDAFCCHGCASAYQWISNAGLGDFYKLRDESAAQTLGSQNSGASNFAHFDDPEYLAKLGIKAGDCELQVLGLHCAACVWLLEQLPQKLEGLVSVRVNWQSQVLHLRWDPERLALSHVAQLCSQLGYRLVADDLASKRIVQAARRRDLLRLAITGACAGNVMLVSLALYSGELSDMDPSFRTLFSWFAAVFCTPCVVYGAQPFYRAALASLKMGRLHLDVPIACGVVVGFAFGIAGLLSGQGPLYFDTIAMLVFLLLLGRRLQAQSRQWAYSQAGALNVLLPASTRVRRNGQWQAISRTQLEDEDLVRVDPGCQVPADGTCVQGQSHVDTRALTGESHPIAVGPGAAVLAGSHNLGETFIFRVTARDEQSRLGKVAQSLARAAQQRTQLQSSVNRISGYFSWTVLILATLAGGYWYAMQGMQAALDVFLATLIISCPCALGLATPLALALARAHAAKLGIVVANERALEDLAKLQRIAFDKTGTLTCGEIQVVDVKTTLSLHALQSQVATLERKANHPIAASLLRWSHPAPADPDLASIEQIPGQGIRARQGTTLVTLGRFRDAKHQAAIQRWHQAQGPHQGDSCVYLAHDHTVVGALGLQDRLRPGAKPWIQELLEAQQEITILSGDSEQAVHAIAQELGVTQAYPLQSPEDKLQALKRAPSIMIGDGINDAPALRCAAVGIAVGQNAEISAKVADIYVIRPSIPNLRALFDLAYQTHRTIKRNLAFALTYNLIFATAAITGHIQPLTAAIIMPLSSLSILASSWWTMRPPRHKDHRS